MGEAEQRSRAYYDRAAFRYDWSNRVAAWLRGASDMAERRKAVAHLAVEPGHSVLEICVGTGLSLPLLENAAGPTGAVTGLDISPGMLRRCRDRLARLHLRTRLVEGDGGQLPFRDAAFDRVFHHGGLAEFSDRGRAIREMFRVARPGARIVICDVGVPTDRRLPLMSRLLLRLQPAYDKPPPLDLLPPEATGVALSWIRGQAWYLLEATRP